MHSYDEETERYLREFRPRAIHPLQIPAKAGNILPWRLAAAAVLVLLVGGLLWFTHREAARPHEAANVRPTEGNFRSEPRFASTLALTNLALEDNEKLESLLADESRKSLPTVQGKR